MSIIDTLIFDRTVSDVQRIVSLAAAAQKRTLTDTELTEWNAAVVRGAYNAEDLNRVGEAAVYVNDYLTAVQPSIDAYIAALGVADDAVFDAGIGDAKEIAPRTDYARDNTPLMRADVQNTFDAAFDVAARIGIEVSVDIGRLTFSSANAVERALYDAYHMGVEAENTRKEKADKIAAAWYYSGDLFCGE